MTYIQTYIIIFICMYVCLYIYFSAHYYYYFIFSLHMIKKKIFFFFIKKNFTFITALSQSATYGFGGRHIFFVENNEMKNKFH